MVYSDVHKFVYYSTPKAGSTSITDILKQQFGAKVYNGIDKHNRRHPVDPRDRHDTRCPPEFAGYFQFASCRHPLTRAISGYTFVSQGKDLDLNIAFRRFHLISQYDYVYGPDLKVVDKVSVTQRWRDMVLPGPPTRRIDAVIHAENLLDEFNALPFVEKKVTAWPRMNTLKPEWRRPALQDALWDKVLTYHKADFAAFGYEIDADVDIPML